MVMIIMILMKYGGCWYKIMKTDENSMMVLGGWWEVYFIIIKIIITIHNFQLLFNWYDWNEHIAMHIWY